MSAEAIHRFRIPKKHTKAHVSDLLNTDFEITKTNPKITVHDDNINAYFDLLVDNSTGLACLVFQTVKVIQIGSTAVLIDRKFRPINAVVDLGEDLNRFRDFFLSQYVYLGKVSSLPTASSTYRGCFVRVEGAGGVADLLYCCMKSAADTYSWVQVAIG